MRQKKHGPRTRAKRSYWKSGLRDYVLADPEPPTSSNYPETIVLPPCVPRSISSLSCLVPRERSTKERVPSWQSYDALIKNYHPPTTKGALARHSLSPSSSSQFTSSTILSLLFFFLSCRHFVFLFISLWSPGKLNKPRPSSLRSRKLDRRIKSYSPCPSYEWEFRFLVRNKFMEMKKKIKRFSQQIFSACKVWQYQSFLKYMAKFIYLALIKLLYHFFISNWH